MNRRTINLYAAVAFILLSVPLLVYGAVPPAPHNSATIPNMNCASCHKINVTIGKSDSDVNVCLQCHYAGGSATKKFMPGDMANPFGTSNIPLAGDKSSHKWTGSDTVPQAGAVPPRDPYNTTIYGMNKSSIKGYLTCARCHNVHGDSGVASQTPPLLRSTNAEDSMCRDCHSPRDKTSHVDGTHPVMVGYTTIARQRPNDFFNPPQNANPANTTSEMKLSPTGKVNCSTCHGVHFADSNSRTVDSAASASAGNLSTSKGYLLRTDLHGATATSINICTNCHKTTADSVNAKVANHNGTNQNIQCADCHGGHVEYESDPATVPNGGLKNVFLINRYMNVSTGLYTDKNSVTKRFKVTNKRVFFQYTALTKRNYTNQNPSSGDYGVCYGCHTSPLPASVAQHATSTTAADCNQCHKHSSGFSADCTSCHGYPPKLNVARGPDGYAKDNSRDYLTSGWFKDESQTPHARHAGGGSDYGFDCSQCHKGNTHNSGAGSFQDVFINKVGIIASNGASTPTYNPTANSNNGTCSTTYCHSNGAPAGSAITYTTPQWGLGKGTLTAAGCGACHAAKPATNAHNKHVAGGGTNFAYGCVYCHATTVSNDTTLLPAAKQAGGTHVNGTKDYAFSGSIGTNTLSGSNCSNVYCHSNGGNLSPRVYSNPTWTTPASGQCGTCHATDTLATLGHTAHLTATYGPKFNTSPGTASNNNCKVCHSYTSETGTNHLNGSLDFVTNGCTTCHPQAGTYPWQSGRVTCESCHTGTLSVINSVTAPSKPNFTGSGHGQAAASYNASRLCSSCHDANSAHIDGIVGNQKRIAVNDNTLCTGCHNDAAKVPTVSRQNVATHVISKTAGEEAAPSMDCKLCHEVHGTTFSGMIRTKIAYGINSTVSNLNFNGSNFVQLTPPYRGLCQGCHTLTTHYRRGVDEGTNHPTTGCLSCHQHKASYAFKPGACDGCHGYPPAPSGFVGTQNNYSTAKVEDYTNGGGAHVVAGHIKKNARPSEGWANCTVCHGNGSLSPATHMNNAVAPYVPKQQDVTMDVDDAYKFNSGFTLDRNRYTGPLDNSNNTGSCSNVSCHFKPTPKWAP